MNKIKKLFLICFSFFLSLTFVTPALAANIYDCFQDVSASDLQGSVILSLDSDMAFVNGQETQGAKPILVEEHVLVPTRFIAEAMGITVNYDTTTKVISIDKNNNKITFSINSKEFYMNGEKSNMDVAAQIYENITYIPLRTIGEALGKKVVYETGVAWLDSYPEGLDYKLIFIFEPNGIGLDDSIMPLFGDNPYEDGFSNQVSYKHYFACMCTMLFNGVNIVYGDRYFGVFKSSDGQLYIMPEWDAYSYYKPILLNDFVKTRNRSLYYVENKIPSWHKTTSGNYLYYSHRVSFHAEKEDYNDLVYKVDSDNFQRICTEWLILDIKFTDQYMYLLTGNNIYSTSDATNLVRYDINNPGVAEHLGHADFVYGYDFRSYQLDETWEIKEDGIYIIGYNKEKRQYPYNDPNNTVYEYALYKVNLSGNSHEKIDDVAE